MIREFPHSATIYYYQQTRQPGGEYEDEKTLFKEIEECFMSPLSGSQLIMAMQATDQMDYELYIPYESAAGITSDMTVEHDGVEFDIVSPGLDEGGQREIVKFLLKSVD